MRRCPRAAGWSVPHGHAAGCLYTGSTLAESLNGCVQSLDGFEVVPHKVLDDAAGALTGFHESHSLTDEIACEFNGSRMTAIRKLQNFLHARVGYDGLQRH